MSLSAGAAKRDISPTKPMQLYGYPHVKRICEGAHDPLYACVLYLNNGKSSLVQIALDILMLEPPRARQIRDAVAHAVGVEPAAVMISCTHTHSGPVTTELVGWVGDIAMPAVDPTYLGYLEDQIVDAARSAKDTAGAAELAWTTANGEGVGGNRIVRGGLTDSEVGVLAVRKLDTGRLLALVTTYGMHPTVMHEDTPLVSSDFPGYARLHLREAYGDDLVVVYHNGPCGNQSPRNFVNGQTFEEAERLGRMLGQAIVDSLDELAPDAFHRDATLAAMLRVVDLPRREIPPLDDAEGTLAEYQANYERLKAENAGHHAVRTAECAVFGAEGSVALSKANAAGRIEAKLAAYPPYELQAHRINGAAIVGWPGECFVEYALEFKKRAPVKAFVAAFVNGELQGYIVTPEVAAEGGYEATNAVFAPGCGQVFIDESLAMLNEL